MVGISIDFTATSGEITPDATIAIAPRIAIPVLSRARPGISPMATPAYVLMNIMVVMVCKAWSVNFLQRLKQSHNA